MKLKELLEKVEELSKTTTGELAVALSSDCKLDKDVELTSKSSVPRIDITIKYPPKEKK